LVRPATDGGLPATTTTRTPVPDQRMAEPAIRYLSGSKNAGAFWSYGDVGDRR
jgi:hypothetical protein